MKKKKDNERKKRKKKEITVLFIKKKRKIFNENVHISDITLLYIRSHLHLLLFQDQKELNCLNKVGPSLDVI